MRFCSFLNIQSRRSVHRTADAIRLDGGRNLIGWRTQSDWMADAIRSDGGRNLIGRRTQSDRMAGAIGDEKRVCQKSNKMSCKPKSIDF